MQPPVELIAGLGNPGERYDQTRHNAGFWLLDALARRLGAEFIPESRFHGDTASGELDGRRVRLIKPSTFMNRSGQAVGALARYFRIAPENVLVVHDEIDLPPGVARLKRGGGHGGHNGLRDILTAFGGDAGFLRLRIGVGHPGNAREVVDYVLKSPPAAERALIDDAIGRSLEVLAQVVAGDTEKAMHRLHSAPDAAARA